MATLKTKHRTLTHPQLSILWKNCIASLIDDYYFLSVDIYSLLFNVSKNTLPFPKDYHDIKQTSNRNRPRLSTKKKTGKEKALWLVFIVKLSRVGNICRYYRRKSLLKCGCQEIKIDHLSYKASNRGTVSPGNLHMRRRFNSHQVH